MITSKFIYLFFQFFIVNQAAGGMATVNPQAPSQTSQQQPGQMMATAAQQPAQFNQFSGFQVGLSNLKIFVKFKKPPFLLHFLPPPPEHFFIILIICPFQPFPFSSTPSSSSSSSPSDFLTFASIRKKKKQNLYARGTFEDISRGGGDKKVFFFVIYPCLFITHFRFLFSQRLLSYHQNYEQNKKTNLKKKQL